VNPKSTTRAATFGIFGRRRREAIVTRGEKERRGEGEAKKGEGEAKKIRRKSPVGAAK